MRRTSTMSILGLYEWDNTLFEDMVIPSSIDKDLLVNNLLMELAELEVIYTSPVFMKSAIAQWSAKELDKWTKQANALNSTYDPTHNYDRTETVTETGTTSGNSDSTNKVAGYNSTTLQDASKNESNSNVDSSVNRSIRAYGNIGVTTTEQMITEEMELRNKYNIDDVIINDFKNRFCLLVY